MPALLAHVDDRRLTRAVLDPWDHSASRFRCVGELVSDVVQGIAGDPGLAWRRTDDGRYLVRGDVAAWWKVAREQSEEAYAVAHVLPASPEAKVPYAWLVSRIAEKYPGRLGEVYRRLLREHPHLAATKIVTAIARSGLTTGEKVDLLTAGAESTFTARQTEALEEVATLDRSSFEKRLIAALQKLPAKTAGPFAECEQLDLARLCWKTDSREVWDALLAATRRAEIGVRMEIIEKISLGDLPPELVKRNVNDFLVALLDDLTVRDVASAPEKYTYCAASQWPQIAVGDWAAYQLANRLEIDVGPYMPYRKITADDWAQLRKQVRERWAELRREPTKVPLKKGL